MKDLCLHYNVLKAQVFIFKNQFLTNIWKKVDFSEKNSWKFQF